MKTTSNMDLELGFVATASDESKVATNEANFKASDKKADDDRQRRASEVDRLQLPDYCQTIRFVDPSGQERELIFPKALDLDRPKRPRTIFSEEQLTCLEHEFRGNQYVVGRDRRRISQQLGISETQVKVWFQNRRTKFKRDRARLTKVEMTPRVINLWHPKNISTNLVIGGSIQASEKKLSSSVVVPAIGFNFPA